MFQKRKTNSFCSARWSGIPELQGPHYWWTRRLINILKPTWKLRRLGCFTMIIFQRKYPNPTQAHTQSSVILCVPNSLSMSNTVTYNQNHLGYSLWTNRRGTVTVDTPCGFHTRTCKGGRATRREALWSVRVLELWSSRANQRKTKHTTVVAYIHVGVLSTQIELVFRRH